MLADFLKRPWRSTRRPLPRSDEQENDDHALTAEFGEVIRPKLAALERALPHQWGELRRGLAQRRYDEVMSGLGSLDYLPLTDGGHIHDFELRDYLKFSKGFLLRQRAAIARGIPPLLITSMQKSASVFLVYKISEALEVPATSLGRHPDDVGPGDFMIPPAARLFALGGAITHDHFRASRHNLEILARAGLRKAVVQLRDPREAFVSLCYHMAKRELEREGRPAAEPALHEGARKYADSVFLGDAAAFGTFEYLLDFAVRWLAVEEAQVAVLPVWYPDVVSKPAATIERILGFFGVGGKGTAIAGALRDFETREGEYNFRSGRRDEWRGFLRPDEQAYAERRIAETSLQAAMK